ncbi:type III restriction endonuclease EcoPI subunit R [Tepiditoga spiralis]|uniref:Type III restriction endonuclease EcoPI subunit R n=1 Tax=Tepiditoga spiralis TaxID=2108365 RepID=A0A7G1G786_9BACT|nr:type III restriction-modification system endonuclease [Tepiditoga spiralis]BBE31034.1 type III restriction endonuclease EcoPI subunit R [Tepiditoga spiralis]
MAGFNFEKNLEHQSQAVKSTVGVFNNVEIVKPQGINKEFVNPVFDTNTNFQYIHNIGDLQEQNSIERKGKGKSNIIDIMMETGTGKTYTYTKTIFELNKLYGIFKFIIVVPTLPIKAGTIDFLNSDSAREHFKEQYGKTLKLHIVESKKSKKPSMPSAVTSFVNARSVEKNKIQVLIINAGMINASSKDKKTGKQVLTLGKSYDKSLLDKYSVPFEAISSVKPFMIIDEPHKFDQNNKTWQNIQKMNPQFIIRYGATFKENENLIYILTAVDSFNRNLVKGVIGHITEFEMGKNVIVKFVNSDGKEASFKKNNIKKHFKITKNESLEKVHNAMTDLFIEKLNKSTVVLSNGLELKKGDKINPYSYAETLQETMIQKAIKYHFEKEKEYLTREVKIKPLTLFFIDNIEEYRNKDGYIRKAVEKYIKAEVEKLLKTETNEEYKAYLKKTLKDISKTHGGYFSKDNSENDELIEKEVNEILHDKQAILDLENPRRFIFSKWTLREGWDNPNIFQICKLRSSGSEISKLQEVGRGLRLPINQYGNRVKDEQFYLNYFVDFTENDFVEKLVNEINEKSGAISREDIPKKLTDKIIKQIVEKYKIDEDDLLEKLDNENVIKRNNDFKKNGFEYIKANYPLIFEGVDSNKVRKSTDKKKKIKVRVEKYAELKELWEKLNEKVVLEYKIENENEFQKLFVDFLQNYTPFEVEGVKERTEKIDIENDQVILKEEVAIYGNDITPISTIQYSEFLKLLSDSLNINLKTLHKSFLETKTDINKYLNQTTLRLFKQKFNDYLMYKALSKFQIGYQKVASSIHPTKFTNKDGKIKTEVNASDIGVFHSDEKVADNYFFDEIFFDSELEEENIKENIKEVIVFTKIPKNSIKIPVAGGKSYSPDFAYVLNFKNGKKKLYFIVETKNTNEESLRNEEIQKIKHAEKFFGDMVQIKFKTQFSNKKMANLIQETFDKNF